MNNVDYNVIFCQMKQSFKSSSTFRKTYF